MTNTFKLKKGLGRGLSSLIGDTSTVPKSNKVAISSIVRNKFQVFTKLRELLIVISSKQCFYCLFYNFSGMFRSPKKGFYKDTSVVF